MGAKTSIAWSDATWSPIRARVRVDARQIAEAKGYESLLRIIQPGRIGPHCEHASPGCKNCYSESNNSRCLPANGTGLPFDRRARDLVTMFVDDNILGQPLRWRKPRRIFVESQSDLFGEFNSDLLIDRVVAAMLWASQHTYQVLSKRSKRMLEYSVGIAAMNPQGRAQRLAFAATGIKAELRHCAGLQWPPSHIWFGVSAEDQQRADERIPDLLRTPAAVRFVSYEPALSSVDFNPYLSNLGEARERLRDSIPNGISDCSRSEAEEPGRSDGGLLKPEVRSRPTAEQSGPISLIIVGGESGRGARPFNIYWALQTIDQCRASGTACFVKQLGAKPFRTQLTGKFTDTKQARTFETVDVPIKLKDRKGANPAEWPSDIPVIQEFPNV